MSRYRQSDGPAYTAEFLDDRGVFDISHPRAAVFLGKKDAHKAEFGKLWAKFDREMLRFVPFHHIGFDLALGEFANAVFDLKLLFGKFKVHNLMTITNDYHRIRNCFEAIGVGQVRTTPAVHVSAERK